MWIFERVSSCRSHLKIATEIDSDVFKITLPTKPSHTTTSTGSSNKCRPSILPRKFSELSLNILKGSFVRPLPLISSSPNEIRPSRGLFQRRRSREQTDPTIEHSKRES